MSAATRPMVSVLVVATERTADLEDLYRAYAHALRAAGWTYEFIFVLDPRYSGWAKPLLELRSMGEGIRVVEVAQSVGEATLLRLAAEKARGQVFLSLPAYWRVEPGTVPDLLQAVEAGADMVVARRWPRTDSWINRLQNRLFHGLVRSFLSSQLHDLACGVRAFRPAVLEEVPLYGDFHRFFPLLADRAGFRVEELQLPQHPADIEARVYSPGIYIRRLLDLLGLVFLLRFANKPLRFFGMVGSGLSLAGAAMLVVLAAQRIGGQGIADRPMLLLSVLLLALGVQAVALGLIGEIIVFLSSRENPPYRLAREPAESARSPASAGEPGSKSVRAVISG